MNPEIYVSLSPDVRAHLKDEFDEVLGLRKVPTTLKVVLHHLNQGRMVVLADALNALFYTMSAAISANGQSRGRSADRDACEAIWREVMEVAGLPHSGETIAFGSDVPQVPDLTTPAAVEEWLLS